MNDNSARPSSKQFLEQMRSRRQSRTGTKAPPMTQKPAATNKSPAQRQQQRVAVPAHQPPKINNSHSQEHLRGQLNPARSPNPSSRASAPAEMPNISSPGQNPPDLGFASPPASSFAQRPPSPDNTPQGKSSTSAFNESQLFPGQFKPVPEDTIFAWQAMSRPFKKRNRQFYTTVGLITFLISLILFLAGQFLPIAVVLAVAFLAYVLSSVPPDKVENKITTHGIRYQNEIYYWNEMGRFWFDNKYDQEFVSIEVAKFPGRLTLMIGEANKNELKTILAEVLLKEKPKDTFYDKAGKWLQDKIPLETAS
jgi:hypothetical protein